MEKMHGWYLEAISVWISERISSRIAAEITENNNEWDLAVISGRIPGDIHVEKSTQKFARTSLYELLKKYPGFFQKETVVGRIFGKFFKTNPLKSSRGIPRRAHTVKGFVKKFLSDCLSEDSFEEIFERLVVRTFEIAGEIYERMLGKMCGWIPGVIHRGTLG